MAANPALQEQLAQVTNILEQQVDAEINRLDTLEEEDYEVLRQRRLQQLKKAQKQKQEWMGQGHGRYEEISDEKEFFDACKKSKRVICHFYRDATLRCKIVDKHLEILAGKHVETRFIKINAEKCKFLVERLRIVVLPTICLAKDGKTVDYVVGFDDLGGSDDFSTEMMEWRLARSDVINYSGDLMTPPLPPGAKSAGILGIQQKKTIRQTEDDSSDDGY